MMHRINRTTASSAACKRLSMLAVVLVAALLGAPPGPSKGEHPPPDPPPLGPDDIIPVDVSLGTSATKNVGCGFDHITQQKILGVDLYWPIPDRVESSEVVECNPEHIWEPLEVPTYRWRCYGVEPIDQFWVLISAKESKEAGGGGGGGGRRMEGWMSVSDVDIDADTDNDSPGWPREPSRTREEDKYEFPGVYISPADPGLVLGVNDDHDQFPPGEGRDYQDDTAVLAVEGSNYEGHSTGLAELKVKLNAEKKGTLKVSYGNGTVRLFDKDGNVLPSGWEKHFEKGRYDADVDDSLLFYAEGLNGPDNTDVTATFTPDDERIRKAEDVLSALRVPMDIDVDSNNNGTPGDSDAEDLGEAGSTYMLIPVTDDLDQAKPGILRCIADPTIHCALAYFDPVLRLRKVGGSGDVRVWNKEEEVWMLEDTSVSPETSHDGTGTPLWDRITTGGDLNVSILGSRLGDVLLGLELTLRGTSVKVVMDVVKVGQMDLDIDSDNDNGFDLPEQDDNEDRIEMDDPGKLVMLNATDDDKNTYPMVLEVFSADGAGKWKLKVSSGADKVKFYLGSDRSNPLPLTAGETAPSNISAGWTSITVYVEGSALSAASGDVTVELWTDPDGGGSGPFSKQDEVKMTVWWMNITRILDKDEQATNTLVIGEDYRFEYTLEPAGITLPKALFKIVFTNAGGNEVVVHQQERETIVAGTLEEPWNETKWKGANDGCYANPKNGEYLAYWAVENTHRCSNKKNFTTQLILAADLKDDKPSSDEISSGIYKDSSYAIRIGIQCDGQAAIMGTSPEFSGEDPQNLDNDTDDGPEIRKVHIKQTMPPVDPGDYKVVIEDLRDKAGNVSFDDSSGIISDWTIKLR